MDKFKVMLHDWRHYTKDNLNKWVPAIRSSILNYPKQVTLPELAKALIDGHTVILGQLEYDEEEKIIVKRKSIGASSRHWKSQQLFAIDVDNEKYHSPDDERYITIEKAIAMCKDKGVPPAFIYTTYSHKEDHHKFRVVFALSKEITSPRKRQQVIESIFEIFAINKELLIDSKCSDPSRLFYPGKKLVYEDYEARINPDQLIKKIKPTYNRESVEVMDKPKKLPPVKNETVKLLRKGETNKVIKKVADYLRGPSNPYQDWVPEPSTKLETITLYKIIKDYCPEFGQHGASPVFMRVPDDYYDLACRFPIHVLFGLEFNKPFRCILPGHNDSQASARIEKKHSDNTYIYHCYGCMAENKYYDIFDLLEHAIGWNHEEAKRFINKLLGVEFESEWQKEQKIKIMEYQDFLHSEHFEERFPVLYKELVRSNSYGVLNIMLTEARRKIFDKLITEKEQPVFFMSIERIIEKMKDYGITRGTSKSAVQRKIKFITKLKLLDVVADEHLPKPFLEASHQRRRNQGNRYRVNYYMVPEFSTILLHEAEDIIREMKNKNIKRQYYSRQTEVWANGVQAADEQYVQDKGIGKSKRTIEFYEKYKEIALGYIEEKGYTTEKEILNHRRIRGMKQKKELSATVMPQLLQEFDLQITRYNKYYKELFQIKQDKSLHFGSSKIIIKSENVKS